MNYLNELNLLMKEISFIPSRTLRSIPDRGYFIIHGKYNNLDVVLRTAPNNDLDKIVRFKREYEASKVLKLFNSEHKKIAVNFTAVIDFQKSKVFIWSIRSFSKDQTLAIDEQHCEVMLHGYDVIRQNFVDNFKPIVRNIIKTIQSIQQIDISFIEKKGINTRVFAPKLDIGLEKIDIKKIDKLLSIGINNLVNFYSHNIDEYCDKSNIRANVGDLVPSNIIVNTNNQITLNDYEWFCFDNYTIDLSYLWLYFWHYPKWQEMLKSAMIISEKDKKCFRISLIRELISWFGGAFSIKDEKNLQLRINFYKKHIWSRYLKAAGESFEAIMKVKSEES